MFTISILLKDKCDVNHDNLFLIDTYKVYNN